MLYKDLNHSPFFSYLECDVMMALHYNERNHSEEKNCAISLLCWLKLSYRIGYVFIERVFKREQHLFHRAIVSFFFLFLLFRLRFCEQGQTTISSTFHIFLCSKRISAKRKVFISAKLAKTRKKKNTRRSLDGKGDFFLLNRHDPLLHFSTDVALLSPYYKQ